MFSLYKGLSMRTTNEEKARQWEQKIAECRASGLSVDKWCRANGEKKEAMKYWVRKLGLQIRKKSSAPKEPLFQKLNLIEDDGNDEDAIPIALGEAVVRRSDGIGIKIKAGMFEVIVSEGFDAGTLKEVLKVVKAAC